MKTPPPISAPNGKTLPASDAILEDETDFPESWDAASGPDPDNFEDSPEVPPGAEELTTWDEVPAETEATSGDNLDDEAADPSALVEEGIEEADRELRLEAADEPDDEDLEDDAEAAAEYPRTGILS